MDSAELGHRGEATAAKYYLQCGCTLLEHNYRSRYGEIDLILREPEGTLVFCEVKTRAGHRLACPAAAVNTAKQKRLILTAQCYLQQTAQGEEPMRFDVAEVTPLDSRRWRVHIIKDAFLSRE